MSLSVCIICKNEEKNIRRCLESVKDIAEEIVIVDTGSTDKTIKIIQEYNVKLIHHRWNNDFSEARNISISNATKDWILILDADEEVDKINGEKMKVLIRDYGSYEGFFLSLTNIINAKPAMRAIVFRLFKRNPLYKFEGKLHEQIIPSILIYNGQERILDTDVNLLHYGYDPQNCNDEAKSRRNLDILLTFDEEHKDGYYYYSLGNELIRTGDIKGVLECYRKAVELANFPKDRPIYFSYLIFNMIKVLMYENRVEEAFEFFNRYTSYFDDFKDLYFMGALCALRLEKYNIAKNLIYKYDTTNTLHNYYPSNGLGESYNINSIRNAIENGVFMEENPSSDKEFPIIVTILNTCNQNMIPECLDSMRKLNCEKVVFTTEKLLNKENLQVLYGVKIVELTFQNNYSKFKNEVLKYLVNKEKWVMMINSKETLSYIGLLKLQNLLENTGEFKAFEVQILMNNAQNQSIQNEIRIFRNHCDLRFTGKIYDSIVESTIKVYGSDYIVGTDIQIFSNIEEESFRERLSILNSYEDIEKDSIYYFDMGNDFFKEGNYEEAVSMYKASVEELKKNRAQENRHKVLLGLNISIALLNTFRYMEVIEYSTAFIDEFKDFATLYIIKAYAEKNLGLSYEESLNMYNKHKNNERYPFLNLEGLI